MTATRWTKRLPTRPGFYWFLSRYSEHPSICSVRDGKRFTFGEPGVEVRIFAGGLWYGPLTIPKPPRGYRRTERPAVGVKEE